MYRVEWYRVDEDDRGFRLEQQNLEVPYLARARFKKAWGSVVALKPLKKGRHKASTLNCLSNSYRGSWEHEGIDGNAFQAIRMNMRSTMGKEKPLYLPKGAKPSTLNMSAVRMYWGY